MDFTLGLNIGLKLEDWLFLEIRIFLTGLAIVGKKVMPHECYFIFHTLDLDPSVHPLGPNFCFEPVGLLKERYKL